MHSNHVLVFWNNKKHTYNFLTKFRNCGHSEYVRGSELEKSNSDKELISKLSQKNILLKKKETRKKSMIKILKKSNKEMEKNQMCIYYFIVYITF